MSKNNKDGPLNNNSTMRGFSDWQDKHFFPDGYKDTSKVRALEHTIYHEAQYLRTGNRCEHERAKDQLSKVTGGQSNHLENYNQEHNNACRPK